MNTAKKVAWHAVVVAAAGLFTASAAHADYRPDHRSDQGRPDHRSDHGYGDRHFDGAVHERAWRDRGYPYYRHEHNYYGYRYPSRSDYHDYRPYRYYDHGYRAVGRDYGIGGQLVIDLF